MNGAYQVALCACDHYDKAEEALEQAVELLGGKEALADVIRPGMRVLVKVNQLRQASPEEAITTHPAVVRAVVRLVQELGAAAVIGDSPGGPFTAAVLKGVYTQSGMAAIAEETGAELSYNTGVREIDVPGGVKLKRMKQTEMAAGADAVITVAKLKTHGMVGFSGAVKNLYGTVPGVTKVEYHYQFPMLEDFADALVDVCEAAAPVLAVVDAVDAMEGQGPSSGDVKHLGALIVGKNPHACDVVGARLMNQPPQAICTVKKAIDRGLLPENPADVQVLGEQVESLCAEDFVYISPDSVRVDKFWFIPERFAGVFKRMMSVKPVFDKKKCIGCGICAESCPPGALVMHKKRPKVDLEICIRCFCCQEMCPKRAIEKHRPAILRLLK